jgi:hypothetical protein
MASISSITPSQSQEMMEGIVLNFMENLIAQFQQQQQEAMKESQQDNQS